MIKKAYGFVASIALGLGVILGAPSAQATIVQFDFTDATSFGGVDGNASFGPVSTGLGTTMTITSVLGQPMSFNSGGGEAAGCASAGTTLACDGDGIGIQGGANGDEVDTFGSSLELLMITFNKKKTVNLIGIELLDLFLTEGEQAEVSINLGAVIPLAAQSDVGGYANYQGPASDISSILFGALTPGSDFAVARLTIEVVPEPMTLTLLAGSLGGLAWMRRRRRSAK